MTLALLAAPPNTPRRMMVPRNLVAKVGRMYFKRVGSCKPDRCGAACCKVFVGPSYFDVQFHAAQAGIRRVRKSGRWYWFQRTCAMLEGIRCGIHQTKPVTCYEFPTSPGDGVYQVVKRVCSYRFVRITKKEFDRRMKAWVAAVTK